MKNNSLQSTKLSFFRLKSFFKTYILSKRSFLPLWSVFHAGIFLFALSVFLIFPNQVRIESDLFNLIPKSFSKSSFQKADEKMTSLTGQNVFIIVANPEFEQAKTVAQEVYQNLIKSDNFKSVSLYNDVGNLSEITQFLFDYRFNLLDKDSIEQLNTEESQNDFALNALSTAYSGFTLLPLDNLEQDPFLLTELNLQNYLAALQNSGTAMTVKDGVLSSQKNGIWYVMIRGVLSKKGAALASKSNGITEIYQICSNFGDILDENVLNSPGNNEFLQKKVNSRISDKNVSSTKFIFSGTPFHSHKSSTAASKEISLIATISLLLVIIILFLVFRSPKPLIFSVMSITISIIAAFLATLAVFRHIHIITLVFGTSLIGSCIDYSLHYFTHWAGNPDLKTPLEIRNHIMPGLTMAIISTGFCFAILLLAPFTLLKQMSLFCLTGLISSYLTTIAIFPKISIPQNERKLKPLVSFEKVTAIMSQKIIGRIVISVLFAISIIFIIIFRHNINVKNNLLSLYKTEGKLLADEIASSQIIQYNPSGWYLISGDSQENLLQNEEILRQKIEEKTGKADYICTSLFVPSIKTQEKSQKACENLMNLAEFQFDSLCFENPEAYAQNFMNDFYQNVYQKQFISFENHNIPQYLLDSISSVWLGEIDGKYYSVLLPNKIEDYNTYNQIAQDFDEVTFVSKSADVSRDLDKLTIMVIKFFLIACLVMFIVLKIFYSWKQSLKIISVPVLIILVTIAIYAVFKINIEFFSVTGLILVFGLGLDYIIYMIENEKKSNNVLSESQNAIEPFATMLSFVTTVISFGALALSSFQPVHLIGLAIFVGLTTAYVSSFFYARIKNSQNSTNLTKKIPKKTKKLQNSQVFCLFLIVFAFSINSCSSSKIQQISKENENSSVLPQVYITNSKKIKLLKNSEFQGNFDRIQSILGNFGTQTFEFLGNLQIDSNSLRLTILSPMGTDLGAISFDEKGVVLDSAYFPKNLKAEYIICDIQNAYFPAESLYENYKKAGLSFTEEIKNSSENEKKLPNDGEILENSQNLIEKKQIIRKIYDKNKIIEEIVISQNEIKISNKLRNYEYILINLEELN